jgi:hypothetical protein
MLDKSMLTIHRYRATILIASLALLLSTVGLPVVVVACEVGTMVLTKGCGGTCSRSHAASGERIAGRACQPKCRFVEGNTTAFVPVKRDSGQQSLQILAVLPRMSSVPGMTSPFSHITFESPPLTRDIPILVSALLI